MDFAHLPTPAKYALALAVVAVVVAVVLLVNGGHATKRPVGWYTLLIQIGAVLLLLFAFAWLAWHVARRSGRRRG